MTSSDITKCSNETCKIKERCRRWTQLSTPGVPQSVQRYKPKTMGNSTVCNHYWYNGTKLES